MSPFDILRRAGAPLAQPSQQQPGLSCRPFGAAPRWLVSGSRLFAPRASTSRPSMGARAATSWRAAAARSRPPVARAKHSAPRALRSGYAGKKPEQRSQLIRTPVPILTVVGEAFGGRIQLDPCASRWKHHHFAVTNYTRRGLELPWVDRTYANPPFSDLRAWLARAAVEGQRHATILLGPWRSHRHGFCAELIGAEVIYLKAFPFHGQKNTSPWPCFVAAWRVDVPSFGHLEFGRGVVHPPKVISLPRATLRLEQPSGRSSGSGSQSTPRTAACAGA